jgi:hypothetical protein
LKRRNKKNGGDEEIISSVLDYDYLLIKRDKGWMSLKQSDIGKGRQK